MKTKLLIISILLLELSCHKEMPPAQEPCVEMEGITDSVAKVLVYEKRDWPEGYGYAKKISNMGAMAGFE